MKTYQKLFLFLSFTGIIVACATSTQLRKSWSDPSLANNPVKPFKKVLVIVKARNEMYKKPAEDQLVAQIKNGVQFHRILIFHRLIQHKKSLWRN